MLMISLPSTFFFFFFNDTATTEIYTLSLHDALPISRRQQHLCERGEPRVRCARVPAGDSAGARAADASGRARESRRLSGRHPRFPRPRAGGGAVRGRRRALRPRLHHDRARRSHPAARRVVCRARAGAHTVRTYPGAGRRGGRRWLLGTGRRTAAPAARRGGGLMSGLAGVQGDFQDYLLRESDAVGAHVLGTARVPVATRLGIYAGAYPGRLAE